MKWEVDWEEDLWRVPATEDMGRGEEPPGPMTTPMKDLLKEMEKIGDTEFVFASPAPCPVTSTLLHQQLIDLGYKGDFWGMESGRHTYGQKELGFSSDIIQLQIGHRLKIRFRAHMIDTTLLTKEDLSLSSGVTLCYLSV